VNFGLAQEFGGVTHLRFDDTNPAKEDQEYIDAIESDVKWLGFDWSGEVRYASQYFDQLHDWAVELIKAGKAYVDDLTPEQAKEYRGSLTEPGKNSPFRDRSVEENLDCSPACGRRVPGRRARAARQDRHGLAEHEPARPDHVPHPPCPPPPDR
jgi:glutamyl/glutaminyl-tRNA synthetase